MHQRRYFAVGFIGLILLIVLTGTVLAQEAPRLQTLNISLWPEYDDPRVLVIMSGTLAQANQQVRVPLPPGSELNAVAYASEEGQLLTADWTPETRQGQTYIIISVPTQQFHLEYYLDAVSSGEKTVVRVRIPVPQARIAQATLTVQQPRNTTDFVADPPLGNPEPGFDNLMYASRDLGPLSPGDIIEQEVRYTRLVPGLSTTPRAITTPVPSADDRTPPSRNWRLVTIGIAIVLVMAVLVVWWLRRQSMAVETPPVSKGRKRKRPVETTTLPKYCPNCGHPFGPNDRYCAMCGTKRM